MENSTKNDNMAGISKIIAAIIGAFTSISVFLIKSKQEKKENLRNGISYLESSYNEKVNYKYETPSQYSLTRFPSLIKYLNKRNKQKVTIENKLNSAYANKLEALESLQYVKKIIENF